MEVEHDVFFLFPPPPSLPPLISLDGFFLAGFQLSGPESLLALEQVSHVGARFRRFIGLLPLPVWKTNFNIMP